WRWALALGLIPAVYSLVIRLGMPESVRFLETKGRHEEAERIGRDFEASAGVWAPSEVPSSTEAPAAAGPGRCGPAPESTASAMPLPVEETGIVAADGSGRVSADAVGVVPEADQVATGGIWSASLRARTAGLWVVWFCINLSYYGAFIW